MSLATLSAPPAVDLSQALGAGTPANVLAVTSGKGGVGKTFVAANMAAALASRGRKVLLLDADLGLANLDILFNLRPTLTLHDVLIGKASLDSAVLHALDGVDVLPAASGLVEYSRLTGDVQIELRNIINELSGRYDYLILDTGAGISDLVLFTASLARHILVVATPEPTSIADAYATIKILAMLQKRMEFWLVFNQVRNATEGERFAGQLRGVVDKYLKIQLERSVALRHLGNIPYDLSVTDAVRKRALLFMSMPGAPAVEALMAVADAVNAIVPAQRR